MCTYVPDVYYSREPLHSAIIFMIHLDATMADALLYSCDHVICVTVMPVIQILFSYNVCL